MIYGVYSIRDVKTGFMTPVIEVSDEAAARNFTHSVLSSDGILRSFAVDFSLYRIGSFDADSGRITPEDIPQLVCQGSSAVVFRGHDLGGDPDAD